MKMDMEAILQWLKSNSATLEHVDDSDKWRVSVQEDGDTVYLGVGDDPQDAVNRAIMGRLGKANKMIELGGLKGENYTQCKILRSYIGSHKKGDVLSCNIHKSVTIGDYTVIGKDVTICANTNLGEYAVIMDGVHIGHDCDIDGIISGSTVICRGVSVHDRAFIGHQCLLCNKSSVGSYADISEHTQIGEGATIGKSVHLLEVATVGCKATIGEGSKVAVMSGFVPEDADIPAHSVIDMTNVSNFGIEYAG